jgi:glutathione synthase/RimK-type ligase-like ATP-grasp enzyme
MVLHVATVSHTERVPAPTKHPPVPRRIALLTADPSYPVVDVDRDVTVDALDGVGVEHTLVPWTAEVAWGHFDLVVLRSTWDYTTSLGPFLTVLEDIASQTTLVNPLEVVRWNVDKRYLADLAQAGLPVTPGRYLAAGDDVRAVVGATPLPLVVKPVVSAGAKNTRRHDDHRSAEAHASALLETGVTVLVQPYLPAVDDEGETGLVFIGGRYSHAFRKAAILSPTDGLPITVADVLVERITPRQATTEQLVVAQRVVDWLQQRFGTLLYARVDLLPTAQGPVVLEVELVEPNLFFSVQPSTAGAFARQVATWPSVT